MSQAIEFGYIGEVGSEQACGPSFPPAFRHALEVARQSFTSLWFVDHLMHEDTEIYEAWVTLSYAAALVPELQVGHMVCCNSYRSPALVAKMAASLQSLTQGRFLLGYGAGWKEDEYRAYGYDFPSPATRIAMMEEGVQVI